MRTLTARRMWSVLFGAVVVHEFFCPPGELLSEEVDRQLVKRPLTVYLFTAVTVSHLLNWLPISIDPYRSIGSYRMKGTKI